MIFFHSIRVEVSAMLTEAFDSVLTKLRWEEGMGAISGLHNIYTTTIIFVIDTFYESRINCDKKF